jgi:hypothetical protein
VITTKTCCQTKISKVCSNIQSQTTQTKKSRAREWKLFQILTCVRAHVQSRNRLKAGEGDTDILSGPKGALELEPKYLETNNNDKHSNTHTTRHDTTRNTEDGGRKTEDGRRTTKQQRQQQQQQQHQQQQQQQQQ